MNDGKPQFRVAATLGVWTLLSVIFASQWYYAITLQGKTAIWGELFAWAVVEWYIWALLAPFIFYFSKRFRIDRDNWKRMLLWHLPASVLISFAQLYLQAVVSVGIDCSLGDCMPISKELSYLIAKKFHSTVLTYWAVVAVAHVVEYYRRYRDREIQASNLEAQLAHAQLQTLKMQLHPHFLFNTLHAISALMYKDVAAADRMIARLSDLLRMTLEIDDQEVPLEQEIDILKKYLEIEQIRFRDRLTVRMDIPADTMRARVPNLILQPLVENAIKHGISARAGANCVGILAARDNGNLRIEVSDDGCGLASNGGAPVREGVGLSNTQARLRQLYGDDHRFEMRNGLQGGVVVSIDIPYRAWTDSQEEKPDGADSSPDRR